MDMCQVREYPDSIPYQRDCHVKMITIGIGAGPAGPVLAGPLFDDLMKFTIDIFKNCVHTPNTA